MLPPLYLIRHFLLRRRHRYSSHKRFQGPLFPYYRIRRSRAIELMLFGFEVRLLNGDIPSAWWWHLKLSHCSVKKPRPLTGIIENSIWSQIFMESMKQCHHAIIWAHSWQIPEGLVSNAKSNTIMALSC